MASLEEARDLLEAIGMPEQQRNEIAGYTLLAFAALTPEMPWSEAQPVRLNPHQVLEFLRTQHDKHYAENTRETVRRLVIHQWIQGGVLSRNPDDPSLPTNSANTHYALTDEALALVRTFNTQIFDEQRAVFLEATEGGLALRYANPRALASVPVVLPGGSELMLSPGVHNQLQKQIVEEFLSRFAPGSLLLYLGDTDQKDLLVDEQGLISLGVDLSTLTKLADVIAHDRNRDWLFVCEAVTSHGPISPKRLIELEELLGSVNAKRVYVSAFPSFVEYKRFASDIAWETEVWIAEIPDHLLHYDGEHFISPAG